MEGSRLLVGSTSIHPRPGQKKLIPGVRGIGPDEPGLAGRGERFQVAADIAGGKAYRAQAGNLKCAKSWQTPRRCSSTCASGAATVVAVASNLKSR